MLGYKQYTPQEIDEIIKQRGEKDIVSRECKHATYSRSADNTSDGLTVKEWITYKDGLRLPTVRFIKDYKRPYWITKEAYRTHSEKIQFEDLSRVDRYNCRQMDLSRELYEKLKYGNPTFSIRRLANKPYVYGCDFGPEVYLKQKYMETWPGAFKPNLVTVIDSETDVVNMTNEPILWSEVNDHEIVLYHSKGFTKDHPNYADEVLKEYKKTLPEYLGHIKKKLADKKDGKYPEWIDHLENLPVRFVEGETSFDITKSMVEHLHLTQPDIVTGWNVFFDMSVIHHCIHNAGGVPNIILSDSRVPYNFKMEYLQEGPSRKVTASGDMPLSPHERWHKMLHTASWRVCDSMQLYWQLRKAKGKESGGYGLDAVLNRQLGVGKVSMSCEESGIQTGTLAWHVEMQTKYKVPYGVYAIFDSLGLKAQEYKNNDLSSQISSLAGSTDYSDFNSQPKVNSADMHFFAIKNRQKVICTTSEEMETEADTTHLMDRSGWIFD